MVDEIITMVTIDNEWYKSAPHTTILTLDQQGYFLFVLMIIFVVLLAVYFLYLEDKWKVTP
jgi:NADH:ubiquinone oxidoreductase subunit 3 (subunit A)